MKKLHIIIIILSFITMLVSLGYGNSIQNAGDNHLTEHLNIDEGFSYSSPEEIPTLSFKAAFITLFFLIPGFSIQLYVFIKTTFKRLKKLAIGALICYAIIFIIDITTLLNPFEYNFKYYGMIWVLLSLTTIFINGISVFLLEIKLTNVNS
jgi:hypothetical protein